MSKHERAPGRMRGLLYRGVAGLLTYVINDESCGWAPTEWNKDNGFVFVLVCCCGGGHNPCCCGQGHTALGCVLLSRRCIHCVTQACVWKVARVRSLGVRGRHGWAFAEAIGKVEGCTARQRRWGAHGACRDRTGGRGGGRVMGGVVGV